MEMEGEDESLDIQAKFGLQENIDVEGSLSINTSSTPGQLPRTINVIAEVDLVDSYKPRDHAAIVRIYKAILGLIQGYERVDEEKYKVSNISDCASKQAVTKEAKQRMDLLGLGIIEQYCVDTPKCCPSLRSFSLLPMDHNYGEGNDTLADLLKCLPVLEHFTINGWAIERDSKDADAGKDYSDIWLEHLNELEIGNFANLKVELKFVKLILAKSPVLKKVRISLDHRVSYDEELKILKMLLCFFHLFLCSFNMQIFRKEPFFAMTTRITFFMEKTFDLVSCQCPLVGVL
ncbi:NBS-containing resistance-like protein [Tanacetum coccineum]